jgi:predicted 3-demethylubiquinone-9 3-methyltransferase (glyoxalase superfamily)
MKRPQRFAPTPSKGLVAGACFLAVSNRPIPLVAPRETARDRVFGQAKAPVYLGKPRFGSMSRHQPLNPPLSQVSVFVSLFRHSSDGLAELTNKWRQTMAKNAICLWYDGTAEEAARFYARTFPDSAVTAVHRAPGDYPDGKQGQVLTVEFTVVGVPCLGLNGGPAFKHSEAFSFQIVTEDQAETDRYWNAIVGNGGAESECGWCKDKWGLSWQITPRALVEAITDPDRAAAKRAFDAMMEMKKIDIATIEAARRGPARA